MYSEDDLQSAVSAEAISAEAADALRAHVATTRVVPMADEENIRLVTSFNDIFVGIACLLVIFSGVYAAGANDQRWWMAGLLVAMASWLMAEIFTRKRRMALPSIIVLASFVVGLGLFAGALVAEAMPEHRVPVYYEFNGERHTWHRMERYPWQDAAIMLSAAIAAGVGALLHWLRFHVAITIAAGTGAVVLLLLSAIAWATGQALAANPVLAPAAFLCGLAVFAFAMRWDLSDRARRTQRADIAFWLHLLAAPLIAHSLFYWLGVLNGDDVTPGHAAGVLVTYVAFALVALLVDRRALLVSALIYVLAALNGLLRNAGTIEMNLAISTLFVGAALLALSVFWTPLRRALLTLAPESWRERLPASA
ncbi:MULTISPECIES: hypothetical protein [Novosphingobium]|uniref:hypothetical protein n=1 Tax=Novosphingobium TaxID=165696 RepID=UPI0022F277AB|nr:hypothetical protein [Novosphingobium resinovorum]GLK46268.1 hypothetical protein GCM10017612_41900 [Novosphingobium resinovorum]